MTTGGVLKVFWLIAAAVGLAIANQIWGPRARARRRLASASAALADNAFATLTGRVEALDTTTVAPLSGRGCVAYRVSCTIFLGRKPVRTRDVSKTELVSFVLVTSAGRVVVEGDHAEVLVPAPPLIPRPYGREMEFLVENGEPSDHAADASFEEAVVRHGDRVTVHGFVRKLDDTRYQLTAHEETPITIAAA